MARYFHAWGAKERLYYQFLFDEQVRAAMSWRDWFELFAPFLEFVFPWSLARPGQQVVQVGARAALASFHGGSQPILLAHRVGPTGRVLAIEADADSVAAFRQLQKFTQTPWIEFVNVAASDREGEIAGSEDHGHYYFFDAVVGDRATCKADRLDRILRAHDVAPSFVNLTINGYEPAAIRGLGDFLDADLAIAFAARLPEAFLDEGILEELEARGFDLILSNTPHNYTYRHFAYITAIRPHRLALADNLTEGTFWFDRAAEAVAFNDRSGNRLF